jgi:hypothetical protein
MGWATGRYSLDRAAGCSSLNHSRHVVDVVGRGVAGNYTGLLHVKQRHCGRQVVRGFR